MRYAGSSGGAPEYLPRKKLEKQGWAKNIKAIDARLAQTSGLLVRPLSSSNVEVRFAYRCRAKFSLSPGSAEARVG